MNAVRRGLQLAHAVHATHYTHDSYSLESLLAGHMRDLGLEVYTTTMDAQTIGEQNRTSAAATDGRSDRHSGHCVTLHGILRSQLGDGKEALVLVTPGLSSCFVSVCCPGQVHMLSFSLGPYVKRRVPASIWFQSSVCSLY